MTYPVDVMYSKLIMLSFTHSKVHIYMVALFSLSCILFITISRQCVVILKHLSWHN